MAISSVSLAGGGSGATTGSCGAFSGGLMALSAAFSVRSEKPSEVEDIEQKRARSRFIEFREWFIREFGGAACQEVQTRLLGRHFNLRSDEERNKFYQFQKEAGVDCSRVINRTAVKLAQMLAI